jgi:hypothetical protein
VDTLTIGNWKLNSMRDGWGNDYLDMIDVPHNHLAARTISTPNGYGIVRATHQGNVNSYRDIWSS